MLTAALIITLIACMISNIVIFQLQHCLETTTERADSAEENIKQNQEATLHQLWKLRELISLLREARHEALLYDSQDEARLAEWTIKRLEKLT